jgi:hypothetical protein
MTNRTRLVSGRVPVSNSSNVTSDRYQFLDLSSAEPNLGTGNTGDVLTYSSTSPGNRQWVVQGAINGVDQLARTTANVAFQQANNAVSNTTILQGQQDAQNTSISYLQSVANATNSFITSVSYYAQSAFQQANTAASNTVFLQSVNDAQNTRLTIIEATDVGQNTTISQLNQYAQSAYALANTISQVSTYSQYAYSLANTVQAGLTTTQIYVQGINDTQNSATANAFAYTNSAFLKANNSLALAQAAFDKANTFGGGSGGGGGGSNFDGGSITQQLILLNTEDAVSNTTGSLQVRGGAGIKGNLYVSQIYITGNNGLNFPDGSTFNVATTFVTYVLDDISQQFDGKTTNFNLTHSSGQVVIPTNPVQLNISIGNIKINPATRVNDLVNLTEIQLFDRGYIFSNNQIVFATAPSPSLGFFGTYTSNQVIPKDYTYITTPFTPLNIMLGP